MMKLNKATKIISYKVVLVPYRTSHVEKYHKWMESAELRKQTASERLSLAEEYEMQQTWLRDENKCTFIVLDRNLYETTENEVESMIGDVNLYLSKTEEDIVGEIGLMIAESQFRGKGYGKEILLCLLNYGVKRLNISRFIAVISMDNNVSISMFQKFKFEEISKSTVFREVTLSKKVNVDFLTFLEEITQIFIESTTEENK